MAVYQYSALDEAQKPKSGTVVADTPRQAREQLRSLRLRVVEMSEQQSARQHGRLSFTRPRHFSTQMTTAARELATLLQAGIPLLDALDTVWSQSRGKFQTAMLLLRDRVASGSGLGESMKEQPEVFDELSIHMVEVGENAGTLSVVLDQLADFNERYLNLRDRVLTALLYPTLVFSFGIAVSVFLMTFVVPMLLDNLLDAGQQLPWPTRVLRSVSVVMTTYGWIVASLLVAVFCGGVLFLKRESGRRKWHYFLLKIPILGSMARKQAIARLSLIIATLLRSGVEFLAAAEIAARSTKNLAIRDALMRCHDAVVSGKGIGDSLANQDVFPRMVVQIFTVGQQSGMLDDMLMRLAADYDRQVATLSARLVTALEPIMIVTLAVFVGFILFATILPILQAGSIL